MLRELLVALEGLENELSLSSFSAFRRFLPITGRILQGLTFNGSQPLDVNTGMILPGFGRKSRNIEKLQYLLCVSFHQTDFHFIPQFIVKTHAVEFVPSGDFPTCDGKTKQTENLTFWKPILEFSHYVIIDKTILGWWLVLSCHTPSLLYLLTNVFLFFLDL